jgi:hypothetical protein
MQFAFTRPRALASDFLFPGCGAAFGPLESSATAWKLKEAGADVVGGHRFMATRLNSAWRFRQFSTVIGLATRGIMMIESCRLNEPTGNQIPVGWNG